MGHYVYKYVLNDEILYVGKCNSDLQRRLSQHGRIGDNIPAEAWDEINSAQIYYMVTANAVMSDVVESELIRRYRPKWNKAKTNEWTGLPFREPKWILYDPQKEEEKEKSIDLKKIEKIQEDIDRFEHNAAAKEDL